VLGAGEGPGAGGAQVRTGGDDDDDADDDDHDDDDDDNTGGCGGGDDDADDDADDAADDDGDDDDDDASLQPSARVCVTGGRSGQACRVSPRRGRLCPEPRCRPQDDRPRVGDLVPHTKISVYRAYRVTWWRIQRR
jgi:hypothetical protein